MDIVVVVSILKMIAHIKDHKNVHTSKPHHQPVLQVQLMLVHKYMMKYTQY